MVIGNPTDTKVSVTLRLKGVDLELTYRDDDRTGSRWIHGKPTNLLPMCEEFRIYNALYGFHAAQVMAHDFIVYAFTGWMRRTTSTERRHTIDQVAVDHGVTLDDIWLVGNTIRFLAENYKH